MDSGSVTGAAAAGCEADGEAVASCGCMCGVDGDDGGAARSA